MYSRKMLDRWYTGYVLFLMIRLPPRSTLIYTLCPDTTLFRSERHRMRSTIYKRRSTMGEAASWVTIEPVADAIAVLERLSARPTRASGSDTLWPVLRPGAATKTHLSSEIGRAHV